MSAVELTRMAYEVIRFAEKYLNITEGSAQHKEIIDLYNKAREPGAYKMTLNDPWCAAFVCACFAGVNLDDLIPCYAACQQQVDAFKNKGKWTRTEPRIGSLIFYSWNHNGIADHVGIVADIKNNTLTTIEGNYSNTVKYRYVDLTSSDILGFGIVDYTAGEPIEYHTEPEKNEYEELPMLKKGDVSVYVRVLQALLYDEYSGLDIDGEFGPITEEAVKFIQSMWQIEVDGIVGPITWRTIVENKA